MHRVSRSLGALRPRPITDRASSIVGSRAGQRGGPDPCRGRALSRAVDGDHRPLSGTAFEPVRHLQRRGRRLRDERNSSGVHRWSSPNTPWHGSPAGPRPGFSSSTRAVLGFWSRQFPLVGVTYAGAADIRPMPPRRDYFAFLTAASGFQHKDPEFLARRPEVAELTDRRCDRLRT
jgi:hypothetical protein